MWVGGCRWGLFLHRSLSLGQISVGRPGTKSTMKLCFVMLPPNWKDGKGIFPTCLFCSFPSHWGANFICCHRNKLDPFLASFLANWGTNALDFIQDPFWKHCETHRRALSLKWQISLKWSDPSKSQTLQNRNVANEAQNQIPTRSRKSTQNWGRFKNRTTNSVGPCEKQWSVVTCSQILD